MNKLPSSKKLDANLKVEKFRDQDLNIDYYDNFLDPDEAEYFYNEIINNLDIVNPQRNKRTSKMFGDDGIVYELKWYGTTSNKLVNPWSDLPILKEIRERVQKITGESYTVCLIQYYPNGKSGIKPHRDREMIKGTTISGVSLGEARIFEINKGTKFGKKYLIKLNHGSLYNLNPPTNDYYLHSIKEDETINPRISLTFRNYR